MRGRNIGIVCVAAIAVVAASITYVHKGYIGAVENGDSVRLMTRGPHFRLPWKHVWFYPTQAGAVNVRIASEGQNGTLSANLSLNISVIPDSIPSLQRSFHGNYIQALVVPRVSQFIQRHGEASANWDYSSEIDAISGELTAELNSSLGRHGLSFHYVELRSFDVKSLSHDSS